ncbi:Pam16-domain-containing protein [Vararia minispora EC-137]|uniref:Pam16-domain-containing protein n=1 Tax=Vararia minispora EC-137 TaxID=1314806 RepID=A0ACB8QB07_9AGAM|nr:Pam16-domain-containing protein [Vararia minispora EC-137]
MPVLQSSPKAIIQILISGSQILGKAFYAAGRQAVKNAKARPAAVGSDVAGVGNATSGSLTDKLTREHRMTLDEAHLILNVKRGESMDHILKNYQHLLKANSPLKAPPKPTTGGRTLPLPAHSHYVQSKVVRARERIEAELKLATEEPPASTPPPIGGAGTDGTAAGPKS